MQIVGGSGSAGRVKAARLSEVPVNKAVLIETVRDADPATVVDPSGGVMGAGNLFVANASVMPEVWRTNTDIPTIMIAERVAEIVRQRGTA